MSKVLPVMFFAFVVLLSPHGMIENLAMVGVLVSGGIALWQVFRPTKRAVDGLRPLGHGAYIVEKDSKVAVSKRENARR